MKANKIIILATAAAIIVGGLTTTRALAAEDSTPASMPMRGQILERIAVALNLTDEQKSQIRAILSGEKDTLKTLFAHLHYARKDMRAAIQASGANEASVRGAAAKVAVVEADLAVERMKLYGKIAPVLTDEQRQKISDFTQHADDFVDDAIANLGNGLAQ
ncbi:MAG: Spy/CpxP family protein refolding chaperone [Verrucomicrobiota bacterium]